MFHRAFPIVWSTWCSQWKVCRLFDSIRSTNPDPGLPSRAITQTISYKLLVFLFSVFPLIFPRCAVHYMDYAGPPVSFWAHVNNTISYLITYAARTRSLKEVEQKWGYTEHELISRWTTTHSHVHCRQVAHYKPTKKSSQAATSTVVDYLWLITYLKYFTQTRFAAFMRKRRTWQATTPYSEQVNVSISLDIQGKYKVRQTVYRGLFIFSVKFAWYIYYVLSFYTVILAKEVNCWCDNRIAWPTWLIDWLVNI